MSSYCATAPGHPVHGPYHDEEYGFPLTGEGELFERFSLEILQAGLSWELVLKKRPAIRRAFALFAVDAVRAFDEQEVSRLMADGQIIRNRRKIAAIIDNADRLGRLRTTHGGFAAWLAVHHPLPAEEWTRLFRRTFVFVGPEVVRELLLSTGYLAGAHAEHCPVYARCIADGAPWCAGAKTANLE